MKHRPSNKEIVHTLRSIAAAYLLTGANRFRIVAYQKAADAIEPLTQEVYDIWQNGQLETIEGVGPSIKQHLDEYFKDSKGSYFEKQLGKVPASVYELMRAPGIGPKKAYKIVNEFDFNDPKTIFEDTKKAANDNRIAELEGFGDKSEKDILKAIKLYEDKDSEEERMTLPVAIQLAEDVTQYLLKNEHVQKVEPMGSLRRRAPTIGDVDLLAVCDDDHAESIVSYFVKYPHTVTIEGEGTSKGAIMVSGSRRVDLRVISPEQYGAMIQYFTGNKAHNIKLRELALKKNLSLNEFGIKNTKTDELEKFKTEEAFYKKLGLDWIPPEMREGQKEIDLAKKGKLPDLVQEKDIKGEFHVHSNFDVTTSHDLGADSIADMAQKAQERGYDYLALSEHNPAFSKLSADEAADIIRRKKEAIAKVKTPVHLFNSLEIDIQPDGSLALADEAFKHLDMCVISIHSSFRMKKDEMTKRIMKAMTYPKVKIIGHPTGRLLGKREEIDADWNTIMKEAKKRDIALEINSSTERLDLPEGLVKIAIQNGNKLVIDTDAHEAASMDMIRFGVFVARRGWATKSDIMNTRSLTDIKNWISK